MTDYQKLINNLEKYKVVFEIRNNTENNQKQVMVKADHDNIHLPPNLCTIYLFTEHGAFLNMWCAE